MIAYVHEPNEDTEWGGIYCPVMVCDACGKPITESGNAYWLPLENGGTYPQVWHTHKWPCSEYDRVIEKQHGGHVYSAELDQHLGQLRHNFDHLPAVVAGPGRKHRCTKSCRKYVPRTAVPI